jgi:transposase-like protein
MAQKTIKCVHCGSETAVKFGKNPNGKQRLRCNDCRRTFQEEYASVGAKPETKLLIVKMSLNGSGIRDISRVLGISANTVLSVLKKLKTFLST